MGLLSKEPEIRKLRISEISNRKRIAEAVVLVGGHVIVRLKNNAFWTDWPNFNRNEIPLGYAYRRIIDLLLGLSALGILSEEVVQRHLADHYLARRTQARKSELDTARKIVERLGLKLSIPKGWDITALLPNAAVETD